MKDEPLTQEQAQLYSVLYGDIEGATEYLLDSVKGASERALRRVDDLLWRILHMEEREQIQVLHPERNDTVNLLVAIEALVNQAIRQRMGDTGRALLADGTKRVDITVTGE